MCKGMRRKRSGICRTHATPRAVENLTECVRDFVMHSFGIINHLVMEPGCRYATKGRLRALSDCNIWLFVSARR